MTGLRERNRVDRDGRIIRAAARLFRETGYEGSRIEAIAAEADVSVGTIYNYYRNKGDILVAIVSLEVNEVLKAGAGVVARPPHNVSDAIDTLVGIYIDHSLHYLSKEMWRQAMAISMQQPGSPFGRTYTALDGALTAQVCDLVLRLTEIGLIRGDVDARAVGELLFNNMNMMFIEFVKDDRSTTTDLRAALRRQNRVFLPAISCADKARPNDPCLGSPEPRR